MNSIELFTAEQIKPLRQDIHIPEEGPEGWSKSQVDPAKMLENFPALRLNEGFLLRAYQFRSGYNGNAVVWAMPKDSSFPDPGECSRVDGDFLDSPRPPLALDDVMDAGRS